MPFTIRPSRRLPVQCTVTYNAALSMVNRQPASLTEVEEPVRSMFLDRLFRSSNQINQRNSMSQSPHALPSGS
jgi:hypothetical protein